jgi:hypothetical protein
VFPAKSWSADGCYKSSLAEATPDQRIIRTFNDWTYKQVKVRLLDRLDFEPLYDRAYFALLTLGALWGILV